MTHTSHTQVLTFSERVKRLLSGRLWLAVLLTLATLLIQSPVQSVAQTPETPRCDWSGQEYDDFYVPPDLGELTPDRLGEILRVEHINSYTPQQVATWVGIPSSPYGAETYRILYLSQQPIGTPQAVSSLVIVPTGTPPAGGFPLLVDGHGTSGVADQCAPSKNSFKPIELLVWIPSGYVVVTTDYVGLGVPDLLHPYAVGQPEAFSMLDGARSALQFCDSEHGIAFPATNQIILEGHSQGGQAALFAHQEWQSYAPELNVLATVAFAPGSEMRFLAKTMAQSRNSFLVEPVSMAMYAYADYYGYGAPIDTWLREPYASELPTRVENECIVTIGLWLGTRPEKVFQPDLLEAVAQDRWQDLEPWTTYMDANTPGNYASKAPVLILHGEFDPVVPVDASHQLKQRLCSHGTRTQVKLFPAGHGVPRVARDDALLWMADRLAGLPPYGSCAIPVMYLPMVQSQD